MATLEEKLEEGGAKVKSLDSYHCSTLNANKPSTIRIPWIQAHEQNFVTPSTLDKSQLAETEVAENSDMGSTPTHEHTSAAGQEPNTPATDSVEREPPEPEVAQTVTPASITPSLNQPGSVSRVPILLKEFQNPTPVCNTTASRTMRV